MALGLRLGITRRTPMAGSLLAVVGFKPSTALAVSLHPKTAIPLFFFSACLPGNCSELRHLCSRASGAPMTLQQVIGPQPHKPHGPTAPRHTPHTARYMPWTTGHGPRATGHGPWATAIGRGRWAIGNGGNGPWTVSCKSMAVGPCGWD